MKNEERPEVRTLKEAIDKAISKQLSEKKQNHHTMLAEKML